MGLVLATVLLSACVAGTSPQAAAPAPDDASLARGEQFAMAHCSRCHAIRIADAAARPGPPLQAIARRYDLPALSLTFQDGVKVPAHDGVQMPPFQLTSNQADDLFAFIKSLR